LPHDITQAVEQDAIADTLVTPLHSTFEAQHEGADYGYPDASEQEQFAEAPEDSESEQAELTEAVTPEEQGQFMAAQEAFESQPEAQQFEQCSEALSERYAQVHAELDPETCQAWAGKLFADNGYAGLERQVDTVALATVAETASANFEETLRYHPGASAFKEAAGKYFDLAPEQRQSREGQQLYAEAVRAAVPLSSRTMALAVLNDLGTVLNFPNLARSGNPQLLVAQLVMDVAEDAGWFSQQQQQQSRGRFQTNNDLFTEEVLSDFRTL